ncbi:MAG: inositol monophosphatase [Microthrixaceae bacterium]|nr:inositol monophosphatase [Microthrixaceae bacterium]
MPDPSPHECAELAELALSAARLGASLAAELRSRPLEVSTKSTATDLVTNADRAVEEVVVAHILAARPNDGIVAEEGSGNGLDAPVVWVIDPIDGTTNYVYDFPGWATSVGVRTIEGTLLAGAVVDPRHGDEFVAARGRGAKRNGTPLALEPPPPLQEALVATGFGYDAERRAHQAGVFRQVLPQIRDTRRMGAASVDLCSVAVGRVDAYYELGLAEWDLAAGTLIAQESGARVEELDGGPPRAGGRVVAAHPDLWPALVDLLRRCGL